MLQNAIQANQANAIDWVAWQNKISLRHRNGKAHLYCVATTGRASARHGIPHRQLCEPPVVQDDWSALRHVVQARMTPSVASNARLVDVVARPRNCTTLPVAAGGTATAAPGVVAER